MELETSFGRWLRARRRALDLTQDDLARRVGCSVFTVRKIEADERRPSRLLAGRLADSLQIASDDRAAIITLARAELYLDRAVAPARPLPAPLWPPTNLPAPLTHLIGRKQDVAAVRNALLRGEVRLLTLIGPPGIGKTSLSIEVARDIHAAFNDGAYFVALAPLSDPSLVLATIAQTLGVKETAGQPLLETLKIALHTQRRLLLLDNFEHLLEAASLVVELLEACPGLKALVTSRAALHVRGEQLYAVPPLLLPDLTHLPATVVLARTPAVALLVERAQAVLPHFRLTEQNAAAVATICVRLDGLPLAIELAATRIRLLSPEALLARLEQRLSVLTDGARDLPPRHRTLRAAIAWSYELLDAGEQRLFRRLGVFVGGCTLEAAPAVCNADGVLPVDVTNGIASLLDKSLLRLHAGAEGELRFVMLETIREYALERLAASGEMHVIRRRHAAYYLALAEEAEPQLRGAEQDRWLARLEMEHNNLRAALAWAFGGGDGEVGLRLAGALGPFWYVRGYFSEGRTWLEAALAIPPDSGERTREWIVARTMTLTAAGLVALEQGHHPQGIALAEEALALSRELSDRYGMAQILELLGFIAFSSDPSRATALMENALALSRELGDRYGIAETLHRLGDFAREQGEYARATALLEESLSVCRELGNQHESALVLNGLGDVASYQGDFARAAVLYKEALSLLRELESKSFIPWVLRNLGRVAYARGDFARAVALLEESLARFRELGHMQGLTLTFYLLGAAVDAQGDAVRAIALLREGLVVQQQLGVKHGVAESLERFALLAARQKLPERTARLLGAAEALRAAIGLPLPPAERPDYERTVAAARAQLDEATFAAAWAEGQAMTVDEAIAEALNGAA